MAIMWQPDSARIVSPTESRPRPTVPQRTMTNGTNTLETDDQGALYCNYCGGEIDSGRFCGAVCQLAAETEEEL